MTVISYQGTQAIILLRISEEGTKGTSEEWGNANVANMKMTSLRALLIDVHGTSFIQRSLVIK